MLVVVVVVVEIFALLVFDDDHHPEMFLARYETISGPEYPLRILRTR